MILVYFRFPEGPPDPAQIAAMLGERSGLPIKVRGRKDGSAEIVSPIDAATVAERDGKLCIEGYGPSYFFSAHLYAVVRSLGGTEVSWRGDELPAAPPPALRRWADLSPRERRREAFTELQRGLFIYETALLGLLAGLLALPAGWRWGVAGATAGLLVALLRMLWISTARRRRFLAE
jgi:hypothetical protein